MNRPSTRRGFISLLAAVAAAFSRESEQYRAVERRGYRSGKHNGQTRGAFGRVAAKRHRSLYVNGGAA